MPLREQFAERVIRCVVGLVLFGVGIALFVRAELGLAPWDVFHKGLGAKLDVSIGLVIVGVGLLLLLLWIPLRQRPGIGTVLNAFVIGLTVDAVKPFIGSPDNLVVRLVMVAAGLLAIAVGSGLYIGAALGPGPRDGIMLGLAERGVSVRLARTGVEATTLVGGVLLGGTVGVGTVAFMIGIGPLVQLLLPRFEIRRVT